MVGFSIFNNSEMKKESEGRTEIVSYPKDNFLNQIMTEHSRSAYLETKNGQNIYAQNAVLRDNDKFLSQGITLNNNTVETIGELVSSDADLGYLIDTDFSKEELENGVSTPGSDKTIDKDTLSAIRKINQVEPDYLGSLKKSTLKDLNKIRSESNAISANSSMVKNFAAGFIGYTTGKLLQSSLYDNTVLRDATVALQLGDSETMNDIARNTVKMSSTGVPVLDLRLKDPLLFAETVVTVASAGIASGTKIATQLTVGAIIDAGIEYGQQYSNGGVVDKKKWIDKSLENYGVVSDIGETAEMEATLGILMAAGTPALLNMSGRALKSSFRKANNFATKIGDLRLQEKLGQIEGSLNALDMVNEANTFANKDKGLAQGEFINKIIDEKVTLPSGDNLRGVDPIKSSNLLNKKASKIEGVDFQTNISRDRINVTTSEKLKDYNPEYKAQVLLYEKNDGRYDILDGNKVINTTDEINGFVLREADGYTPKDAIDFVNLKKGLEDGNLDFIKQKLKLKNTDQVKFLSERYNSAREIVNSTYKANDELLTAYKNNNIDDNVFIKASKEKQADQLYVAQELSKKSGDLNKALKDIKNAKEWKTKQLDDEFSGVFFDKKANEALDEITEFAKQDMEFRKEVLLEEEKLFGIQKSAKQKELAISDNSVLEYYLDQVMGNNKRFKQQIVEGIRNGKTTKEIYGGIRQQDWSSFGNNDIFNGKRSNNSTSAKAGKIAEQVSELANENKVASKVKAETEKISETIRSGSDTMELNGQTIDLTEKIDFEVETKDGVFTKRGTMKEYLEMNKSEELFNKAMEVCLV